MPKRISNQKRTVTPIKSAPKYLVNAYKERKINAGANLLKRLLEDSRMLYGWPVIKNAIEAKDDIQERQELLYHRVISSIAFAKRESNALNPRRTRKEEKEKYLKIATMIDSLFKHINESPLDVPIIELFDDEMLSNFNADEQCAFKYVYSPEILHFMFKRAQSFAENAMTKPRPDERVEASGKKSPKHRPQERVFVWHLCKDFQAYFGSAMLGTTAKIANVVFETNTKDEIKKSFVQKALSDGP